MLRCTIAALCLTGCLAFHKGAMPGEPAGAAFVEVAGARVRYVDVGQGPAVVLLHGFASSLETWATVVPALAQGHRVLALDLKGFGWTDRPEGDYSPEAQARLVLAVMDARGIKDAAVVAHSWGTSVALAMALAAPERVTRLALYDAWAYAEQLPVFFRMSEARVVGEALFAAFYDERPDDKLEHAFFDKEAIPQPLIDAVEQALERPGTKAAALAAVRGQGRDFAVQQKKYRSIAAPTLLLWGREDEVTWLEFGERLAQELPRARLVVYPRCGHFPMLEATAASNRDLVAFLDGDGR
jgi:pimeloyl-ACP methyl ester carboxylesterase